MNNSYQNESNTNTRSPSWWPVSAIAGLVLASGMSSCIIPEGDYGRNVESYNTYQTGYRVPSLPHGYRSEVISGNTYYYGDGNYYRRSGNSYLITDAPSSSRYYQDYRRSRPQPTVGNYTQDNRREYKYGNHNNIQRLPQGHRIVNYQGRQYYRVGDRYYIRQGDGFTEIARPY